MPAWAALLMMIVSGTLTVLSFRARREAERIGKARLFFWHIPGWGERDRSPGFFKLVQASNWYRTYFLGAVAFVSAAYLLEALGLDA